MIPDRSAVIAWRLAVIGRRRAGTGAREAARGAGAKAVAEIVAVPQRRTEPGEDQGKRIKK